jgi:hypothetical protein
MRLAGSTCFNAIFSMPSLIGGISSYRQTRVGGTSRAQIPPPKALLEAGCGDQSIVIGLDDPARLNIDRNVTNIVPTVTYNIPALAIGTYQLAAGIDEDFCRNINSIITGDVARLTFFDVIGSGASRGAPSGSDKSQSQ